jgi:hypothetical protein
LTALSAPITGDVPKRSYGRRELRPRNSRPNKLPFGMPVWSKDLTDALPFLAQWHSRNSCCFATIKIKSGRYRDAGRLTGSA